MANIVSWHKWEDMFDMARFVAVTRPGYELSEAMMPDIHERRIDLVDVPALAISSTDIRERAGQGRPVWYLVPDGVVQYISKNNLYAEN